MSTQNEKLIAFAQAVGADIKRLDHEIEALKTGQGTAIAGAEIDKKFQAFKAELFGGDLDQAYDTFKEIADKLKALEGSVSEAILAKLTEFRQELTAVKTEITDLKAELEAFYATDYVATYNQAKGA